MAGRRANVSAQRVAVLWKVKWQWWPRRPRIPEALTTQRFDSSSFRHLENTVTVVVTAGCYPVGVSASRFDSSVLRQFLAAKVLLAAHRPATAEGRFAPALRTGSTPASRSSVPVV